MWRSIFRHRPAGNHRAGFFASKIKHMAETLACALSMRTLPDGGAVVCGSSGDLAAFTTISEAIIYIDRLWTAARARLRIEQIAAEHHRAPLDTGGTGFPQS